MMEKEYYSVEKEFKVEFYDVDSMNVVYHGNYVKFMEIGRCSLLDEIGYNYDEMRKEGYSFPVVDIKVRYLKSLHFNEVAKIRSSITEYENCLKVKYEIYNAKGELCTKAESTQMCVNETTGESLLNCPENFIKKVNDAMARKNRE